MSVTSGLLLLLEPGPAAPHGIVSLQSLDRGVAPVQDPLQRLFETQAPVDPAQWAAILIHDSGSPAGSARSLNALHHELGKGGLGYHFVINNGSDRPDGEVEVGFRWQRQYVGAFVEGEGADWFNRHAVGISLIGDGDEAGAGFTDRQLAELVQLVRELQARLGVPAESVYVQVGPGTGDAGRFPRAWFQRQLLTTP